MPGTGHNLRRPHGGAPGEVNCKPNYLSVMNYLFQLLGLVTAAGDPAIDYSRQSLGALDENGADGGGLIEANGIPLPQGVTAMSYRSRWYAYRYAVNGVHQNSLLDQQMGTTPAKRHCDGTPITDPTEMDPGTNSMVRVAGLTVAPPIDWDADTVNDGGVAVYQQDIDFNGSRTGTIAPSSTVDWNVIDLQQLASRRNAGVPVLGGQLSLEFGLPDE